MFLEGVDNDPEFNLLKLKYLHGNLNSEEIIKFALENELYGMPLQGAKILERAINSGQIEISAENLTELSRLFYAARERDKAFPILEKALALSPSDSAAKPYIAILLRKNECDAAHDFAAQINYPLTADDYLQMARCFDYMSRDALASYKPKAQHHSTQKRNRLLQAKAYYAKLPRDNHNYNEAESALRRINKSLEINACQNGEFCENNRHNLMKEICFSLIRKDVRAASIFHGPLVLREEKCGRFLNLYIATYLSR